MTMRYAHFAPERNLSQSIGLNLQRDAPVRLLALPLAVAGLLRLNPCESRPTRNTIYAIPTSRSDDTASQPTPGASERAGDRSEHVVRDERFRQHKPDPVLRELLRVHLISPARH